MLQLQQGCSSPSKDQVMNNKDTAIYCLHGFLGLTTDWNGFLSHIPYSAFCPNLFSEQLQLGLWGWAERFNSIVAASGFENNILCGYSMGARLALHALIAAPKLWHSAVIASGHLGLQDQGLRQQRLQSDRAWAARFTSQLWQHVIADWNRQPVFACDPPKTFVEADFCRERLAASLEYWSLGHQEPLAARIEQLQMPLLFVTGQLDSSYNAMMKQLHFYNPQSRWEQLPLAGHRLLCYNGFNSLANRWLNGDFYGNAH